MIIINNDFWAHTLLESASCAENWWRLGNELGRQGAREICRSGLFSVFLSSCFRPSKAHHDFRTPRRRHMQVPRQRQLCQFVFLIWSWTPGGDALVSSFRDSEMSQRMRSKAASDSNILLAFDRGRTQHMIGSDVSEEDEGLLMSDVGLRPEIMSFLGTSHLSSSIHGHKESTRYEKEISEVLSKSQSKINLSLVYDASTSACSTVAGAGGDAHETKHFRAEPNPSASPSSATTTSNDHARLTTAEAALMRAEDVLVEASSPFSILAETNFFPPSPQIESGYLTHDISHHCRF